MSDKIYEFPEWSERIRYKGKYPIKRYVNINNEFIWLGDEEGAIALRSNYLILMVDVYEGSAVANREKLVIDTWLKDYTETYIS